jgi:hypothetical protein
MALLLPNLRQVLKYGAGLKDSATRQAIGALEGWADELTRRLSRLEGADLSGVVGTTRTINTTTPLTGGGTLASDLTLAVADNSVSVKGVVAVAPNDTAKFWRGDASWATLPVPASTLGSITVTQDTTSTHAATNLTTNGCREWLLFNSSGDYGPNPTITHSSRNYKLNRPRLWNGTNFYRTNTSTVTVSGVGYADPAITVTGSDNNAGNAFATTAITTIITTANTSGHGIYFDLPMEAGETGTFGFACSQIHNLLTMTAELANGDAGAVSNTFANPGATRKYTLGTFAYTIGRATTMRVRIHTTSTTGSTELGPAYVYL